MQPYLNIAGYRYTPLADLKDRQVGVTALCEALNLKGSMLLSPEGLSLCIAGEVAGVERLLAELRRWPGLSDFQPQTSGTDRLSLRRLSVRVKQELIASGSEDPEVARDGAAAMSAAELQTLISKDPHCVLLDVRNRNEVGAGSLAEARSLGLTHFREFSAAAADLPPQLRTRDIVVFCTNGLRAEKAAAWLKRAGFRHVRWLRDGLLGYLYECGNEHFRGECRVTDPHLGAHAHWRQATSIQCERCRTPLSRADREHDYAPGEYCPYCVRGSPEKMTATLESRRQQLDHIANPLPGRTPHDHVRRISIPASCDGLRLIDALRRIVVHVPERFWRDRCAQGLLRDEADRPCTPERIVRAGERLLHRFPAVIEPDVNMQITLLYEDASLVVVDKPAPLPMHAGGRYLRNTLKYAMDALYAPQSLRPTHRLDANTTGVVVLARTSCAARRVQMQFSRGEVRKRYLVRVQGHPAMDTFTCDAPISHEASEAGSRDVDHESGLPARTEFHLVRRDDNDTALLEARPLTGRTHQIRVHLWHLGFPVCGDPVYRAGGRLGDYQTSPVDAAPLCLHAWQLSLRHPVHHEWLTFTALPPRWAE